MNILKEKREVLIGVIIALIIGLLLGFGMGRQLGYAGMASTTQATSSSTAQTMVGGDLMGSRSDTSVQGTVAEGDSVSVLNQTAGMSVKVKSVTLTQEAWVAVRDAGGTTLGAALFAPGTHTDVSVPLLKATVAGKSYQALIYFDDGTKTFSFKTETVVLNPDGTVVGSTFTAK